MIEEVKKIPISARKNADATNLSVTIIKDSKDSNRPYIFVLPGGPGMNESHYKSYCKLQEKVNLVFFNPRGCGLSDPVNSEELNLNNYIDDLEEVRKYLNLDKITLLGKSYGVIGALGYAIRFPRNLKSLIVAGGVTSYRYIETAKENLLKVGTKEQIEIYEKVWKGTIKSQEELREIFKVTASLYSIKAKADPGAFNFAKEDKEAYPVNIDYLNTHNRKLAEKFDFEPMLKSIPCPTLILAGEADWVCDKKYSELMAKEIPQSQLKIFKNASHSLESDVPEQYFSTVESFIDFQLLNKKNNF